jgi:zinc protease
MSPGAPLLALASALALSLVAPRAASALEDPAARTRLTVLDNGLRVLTLVDRTTPVVSFQSWVHVGSVDEARWTGLAHLFEHMMFRGTKNVPGDVRDRLLKERGSRGNAFTTNDVTVYFEDATTEHLALIIDLEADRLRNLVISPEVLDTEREVVLEERRMRSEDNPQGRLIESLLALSFLAHPYRTPVIGWPSDVAKVDAETCREFFRTYYVPNNVVISIAGDFDEDAALARIRERLGPVRRAPDPPRNPTEEPAQRGERRAVVHVPVRAPLVGVAWHAPPAGHPDGYALDALGEILSEGRTSRLVRSLVYEGQQAISAYGGYWELDRAGLFYAGAGVRPGVEPASVERGLVEGVEALRATPPSAVEVEKAKRGLEVSLIGGLGTAHALASRNAQDTIVYGRIRTLDERLARIRAVTPADVQRVAQTYLRPEGRSVVHVIPGENGTAAP